MNGEFRGEWDRERFFETLARLAGEKYGVSVTVKSIRRKAAETGETDAGRLGLSRGGERVSR